MPFAREAAGKALRRCASAAEWASRWWCPSSVRELHWEGLRLNPRGSGPVTRGLPRSSCCWPRPWLGTDAQPGGEGRSSLGLSRKSAGTAPATIGKPVRNVPRSIEEVREQRREERRERMERFRERFTGDGVHLRVFRSYTLAEGETSTEPIVVIGGSAQIDGRVVRITSSSAAGCISGPRLSWTGTPCRLVDVTLDPGATVHGSIDEARFPWAEITIDPSSGSDRTEQAARGPDWRSGDRCSGCPSRWRSR